MQNQIGNKSYWTGHNVTNHRPFITRAESLNYLEWRNSQYLFFEEFLPSREEIRNKVILDFRCGPGNDIVYLIENEAREIYGFDVAETSITQARNRSILHSGKTLVSLTTINERTKLPLQDSSIDYAISFGVLHHIPEPDFAIREIYRVLKPGGVFRAMVYNRDSIWWHLYCAFQLRLRNPSSRIVKLANRFKKESTESLSDVFNRSTDGPNCPYAKAYFPSEFIEIVERGGFSGRFLGSAISLHEMQCLSGIYEALASERLEIEHRTFLQHLTFDDYNRPMHDGEIAGIDALFEFRKA